MATPFDYERYANGWSVSDGSRQIALIEYWDCEIHYLEVVKMYRLCGIGSKLLRLAEADMRAKGCREAFVYAARMSATGRHPRAFYQKNGYRSESMVYSRNHLSKQLE